MALALPHQIFDGTHLHDLWSQVYWWTLYFGTLAAVLPHTPRSCASQYKPSVAAANGSPPTAPTGHSPTTFAVFPHGLMIAAGGGHHPVHRDARRLRTRTGARRLL